MISAGKTITSAADELVKMDEETLVSRLRNPKSEIASQIRQLRLIIQLDPRQYGSLKRTLPYIVCAHFNPPFRKIENFAYTDRFILDIDKLSAKHIDIKNLRERIQRDPRVMMCFVSPGGDGLKVMFCLSERCYDAGRYSLFYKAFARNFSEQYALEQVIDSRTADVSRACFISVDPDAYYNPQAEPIDINAIVSDSDPLGAFDLMKEQQHIDKQQQQQQRQQQTEQKINPDPDNQVMARIKEQLQLQRGDSQPTVKDIIVPQVLNDIIEGLQNHIEKTGLQVEKITNIQYGKKINISLGIKKAEINLFYGRRGFSIVQTPKAGTNAELSELAADLTKAYIDSL